jgi:pimeloyl-ACP methyl ester carboxylesterase
LILYGKQDGCIGPDMYRHIDFGFTPRTPHRAVGLEHCGHFPQHEKVDEVAHQLSMFLG